MRLRRGECIRRPTGTWCPAAPVVSVSVVSQSRDNRPDPREGQTGFDVVPERPAVVTFVLVVFVVLVASTIAHLFRLFLRDVIRFYSERTDPTAASTKLSSAMLFVLATSSVVAAAALGHYVHRRWSDRAGIEAIAASARGDGRSMSLRATMLRVLGTFVVSAGLVSIGRESALVESGGVTGAVTGRKSGGRGDALATAGLAAAFASAYHAPVASIFYAEEHLRIRRSPRATVFVVAGALGGHFFTVWLFDDEAIFPGIEGPTWRVAVLGLVVLVPTVVVAKGFLYLRVRVTADAVMRSHTLDSTCCGGHVRCCCGSVGRCLSARIRQRHGGAPGGPIAATSDARARAGRRKARGHHGGVGCGSTGWRVEPDDGSGRRHGALRVARR